MVRKRASSSIQEKILRTALIVVPHLINTEESMMSSSLDRFFEPSAVAVVGASREPGKIGYTILKSILDARYKGKIFPINPKAQEILA